MFSHTKRSRKEEYRMEKNEKTEIEKLEELAVAQAVELKTLLEKLSRIESKVNESLPFNRLPQKIEYEILKQLDFKDYRNLALTCKKWFHTASSAPDYIKPNLKIDRIRVKYPGMVMDDHQLFDSVPSTSLINKITCICVIIHNDSDMDFLRFLHKNRSQFEFEYFSAEKPILSEEKSSIICELVKKATKTAIYTGYLRKPFTNNTCVFDNKLCIENTLAHTSLKIDGGKASFANIVLKQLVSNQRERLVNFELRLDNPVDLDTFFKEATKGLQLLRYNENRTNYGNGWMFKFQVPGSPPWTVHITKEYLSIVGERRDDPIWVELLY